MELFDYARFIGLILYCLFIYSVVGDIMMKWWRGLILLYGVFNNEQFKKKKEISSWSPTPT